MGGSYYYFASTLPMLDFEGQPPFAVEHFLDEAERLTAGRDFFELKTAARGEGEPGSPFLKDWLRFERDMRCEAAVVRAGALNRPAPDLASEEKGFDAAIRLSINEAAQSPDPLAGEKVLDRARWHKLDQMARGHYFDLEFLVVYVIKLSILERYQKIASWEGAQKFEAMQKKMVEEKMAQLY